MTKELDPIFAFVHEATAHLPRRKQRLMAAYYVRALQTGSPVNLQRAVPANLYPAVRHFLAESDWDHREVMARAAAQVLPAMDLTRLACHVSTVAEKWTFAWLGAYDARNVVPVDLVMVGPAGQTRARADYIDAQLDLLRAAPDALLRRAPLAIADALAEDASVRRWLKARGVIYSAKVKPTARALGPVAVGATMRPVPAVLEEMRSEAKSGKAGEMRWAARPVEIRVADAATIKETLIGYWDGGRLMSAVLTNEQDRERVRRCFEPGQPGLTLPRMSWRRTNLRGARAWEHHLALTGVLRGQQNLNPS